jgi:PKD repeat protein
MRAPLKTTARATVAGLMSSLLIAGAFGALLPGVAQADSAPVGPADAANPVTVTADALPTVQINGVAWSQVVVGNTVYVAGKFSSARPAGAAAGTNETTRNNLLAYDVRTGNLITSFAPDLNGQALVVTASPDGSRIYVGGDFTTANGQDRYRVAAYSTSTGQLVDSFRPAVGNQVAAIAVSGSTVYLGGSFATVGGVSRTRLAAVSATDGSLRPWNPVPGAGKNVDGKTAANYAVTSMVVTGNGSEVVVGGRFGSLNGTTTSGIGALDATSGATLPFAVGQLVTNQGDNSAVYSLSTDGTNVYASGYDYYGPGNLEGVVAADAVTGQLVWQADCHGDTYSTSPVNGAVYIAGHPHVCSNIGGYPESNPRVSQYSLAYGTKATGTVGNATVANNAFVGKPAPSVLTWYPTFLSGTYTGQGQANWSVAGNSQYVVYGGEFPGVNNKAQQGLVRFAVPGVATNKIGPDSSAGLTPTVASFAAGSARVSWSTTTDRDNENLTYSVYRSDEPATPVYQTTAASAYRKTAGRLGFLDTGLTNGASYSWSVVVSDPFGNTVTSGSTTATVATTGSTGGAYAATVRSDGASDLWRLGEASGTVYDQGTSALDMAAGSGVTRNQAGALTGDPDTAASFNGTTTGLAATQTPVAGPQTFSVEAFVKTTTTKGGKIVGFGDKKTGTSSNYDRHLYLDTSGYLYFGVHNGANQVLKSTAKVNDGRYHQIDASLSAAGMTLYVDGKLVASRTDVTTAQAFDGYWRIGGDSSWTTGTWFTGTVDDVSVYPTALTAAQVANHYAAATTGKAANVAPTAAFTVTADQLTTAVDASTSTDTDGTVASWSWAFGDGATATGVTAAHTYGQAGSYQVTLTVTDDEGASSTSTKTVTVTAPPPNVAPTAAFTATAAQLTATVDGTTSSDTDGSVASWAWEFGDGSTGTGATAEHAYAQAGAYTVRLTVTDDDGATATTSQQVTVARNSSTAVAADAFDRTSTSGFGAATTGGSWTVSGGAANATVSGGAGHLSVPTKGGSVGAFLNGVSVADSALQYRMSLPAATTGGGTYVYAAARHVGSTDYRLGVRVASNGVVTEQLSVVVNGVEKVLKTVTVPGLTYTPGSWLTVRFDVSGTGTAALAGKVWAEGTTEPTGWQVTATDASPELQRAGGVGVTTYVSGSATVAPVRVDVDDVWAGATGTTPAG